MFIYTRSRLQANVALLTIASIFGVTIFLGSVLLRSRQNAVRNEADAKISTAALALEQFLPANYHDRITGSNSVSEAQFEALVDGNNRLCRQARLQYVWSVLVLGPRQFVFTSATSPDHTTTHHEHARFFEPHQDPEAFADALRTMQPTFSTFRNQWGQGRMVLLPKRDSRGRVYILGASVAVDKVDSLLRLTLAETVGVAGLVALLTSLLLIRLLRTLLWPIESLTQAAHRMAQGDFETSLSGTGSKEAKLLAESLDALRTATRRQIVSLQQSAAQVGHLNDVLRSIRAVDQLILRETDATKLLQTACQLLVQTRGYRLAWIGQPEAGSRRVVPVASAGSGVDALVAAPITWDDSPTGRGPTGTAIRERRPVVIDDLRTDPNCAPWRSVVESCGVCSLASTPLLAGAHFFGAITLGAEKPQAFDAEEIELLQALAQNLAHALQAIADTAELSQAHHELLEQTTRHQTMLDSMMDGFMSLDLQGRVLDCNAACCQLLGYAREELLQLDLPALTAENTRANIPARIAAIVARGSERFESFHRHREGRLVMVEVSAHYLPHQGGRIYAFLRDITVEKQAAISQQRYHLILQHARDAILLVNIEGRILEGNMAAQTLYGYSREELLQLNIFDLRPHETAEVVQGHMAAALAGGILFEARHRRKDGNLIPVEVSAQAVEIAGEKMLLSVIRDSSTRKADEAALRASEQRLAQVAAVTGELIWELDAQGVYTYVSASCATLLGYTPEEIVGQLHFYDLFPAGQRETVRAQAEAIMAQSQKFHNFPNQIQTKQGTVLNVLTSGAPRLDDNGLCVGYYGSDRDVTAQQQAETALRQVAQRLDLATHAAHLGVWEFEVQHDHLFWDDQMYALYGRRAADFQPTFAAWRAALHPDDNERSHATLQGALAERAEYQSEFRIIRPDGEIRHIQAHAHIVRDAAGRALRIIGLNIDITGLKQTETALRQAKEKFQQLAEEINDALFEIDSTGNFTYTSPVFEVLFGYAPSDLLGHAYETFLPEEERLHVRAAFTDFVAGLQYPVEFRITAKDGGLRWVRASCRPIRKDGAAQGLRGALVDITDSKLTQQALQRSEEHFRALVEKALDCFILIDASGIITYISPAIFAMTGRTADTLLGQPVAEHLHPESRVALRADLTRITAHPEIPLSLTIRVKHLDGTWRLLEGLATNLLHHPAVRGILINCTDITARDSLTKQLRQAQKMEAIGTLAGGIAHDFNNMLFAIMGFTTMALKRAKTDPQQTEDLGQIMQASRRSAELVRQLLIFSRQGEKSSVELAVAPLVKETYRLLRSTLPSTIEIRLELQTTRDVVNADPVQIQQIIMNLGTNAYHAMREKGGVLTLQLRDLAPTAQPTDGPPPDDWLCLSVRDTGCGIPAEHLEHLFEPFFTTKAIGEGTGLGLAVVHGIVTAAGGRIEVESVVDQGSTFKVFLPRLKAAALPETPAGADLPAVPGQGAHVLCVDDEAALTNMIQRTLVALNYKVTTFNDSAEALAHLQQHPEKYDLLLTDQTMPRLTGMELIQAARRLRPDLPCILLTGYDSEMVSATQCRALGAYLRHKPLTQEELGNVLHVALRQPPQEEQT